MKSLVRFANIELCPKFVDMWITGNIAGDLKLVISAGSLQSGRVNLREVLYSTS